MSENLLPWSEDLDFPQFLKSKPQGLVQLSLIAHRLEPFKNTNGILALSFKITSSKASSCQNEDYEDENIGADVSLGSKMWVCLR